MTATQTIIEHEYRARGGVADLFRTQNAEVLLDGPAGTGKSRGTGQYILWFATQFPGCRIAVVRKTRVSLTESWLVTWETKVLSGGQDAYYLVQPLEQGPSRATRHSYEFRNGSVLVAAGMDNPTRLFSTEFDLIIVVEATELSENEWESLHRALRNDVAPYQRLVGECNPDAEYHWLNQRCLSDRTQRLITRHADNPSLTGEYLERLSKLTGVRRKRLYLGLWVAAEGQIWANFDPEIHVVDVLPFEPAWHFASVDWGYRNPGVIGVWTVSKDREACLVREVYQTQRNPDWWAEKAAAIQRKYDPRVFVCDPADPANIDLFNHRLYKRGDRNCAIEAMNSFEAGANIVRDRLAVGPNGKPGLYFMRNALEAADPDLVEAKKPTCTVQEIPSYCYREIKDGQPVKEEPAPDSDDHGCDTTRYGMAYLDYSIYSPEQAKPKPKPGTADEVLGITDFMERCKAGEFER